MLFARSPYLERPAGQPSFDEPDAVEAGAVENPLSLIGAHADRTVRQNILVFRKVEDPVAQSPQRNVQDIRIGHAHLVVLLRCAHIENDDVVASVDPRLGFERRDAARDAVELVDHEMSGGGDGVDRRRVGGCIAKIDACKLVHGRSEEKGAGSHVEAFGTFASAHNLKAQKFSRAPGGHHFDDERSAAGNVVRFVRPGPDGRFDIRVQFPCLLFREASAAQGKIERPAYAGRGDARERRRAARYVVGDRSSVLIRGRAQGHEKWGLGYGVDVPVDHAIASRVDLRIARLAIAVDYDAAFGCAGQPGFAGQFVIGKHPDADEY